MEDLTYLKDLSKEEYEKERARLIEEFMKKSRNRDKLEKLQWRIDGVRRKAKTPLKACMDISDMLWESFLELNDVLEPFRGIKK